MCENAKILCPYCLTREIDPAQAICSVCYSKEDKLERGSWDDLRKRKNTDEIQMFTIAKKVDEAFQVPENKAYACREKHEMIQAEALEREMEDFSLTTSEKYPNAERLKAVGYSLPSWDFHPMSASPMPAGCRIFMVSSPTRKSRP